MPKSSGYIIPGTVPGPQSSRFPMLGYRNSWTTASPGPTWPPPWLNYNATVVGTSMPKAGQIDQTDVVLPKNYSMGSPTFLRTSASPRRSRFKERYKFNIFVEMFNAFNVSNLTGASSNLTWRRPRQSRRLLRAGRSSRRRLGGGDCHRCNFGQATARQGQTFGSAGPRAVQIGARFTF